MSRILLIFILQIFVCSGAFAELEKMQETSRLLRDRLYEINDEYWHKGDYNGCLSTLRLILEIDPSDYDAYDSSAWLLQNDFRDDEAEALLREGLSKNPNVYDLYFSLGYFLFMHERHDEAIAYLETAITFNPPFFVHHTLAHARELAGDTPDALDLWLWLEAVEPDPAVPKLQIDRILSGGHPTETPAIMQKMRADRKARSN